MIKNNVTCPFCGLLCDDLKISLKDQQLKVENSSCQRTLKGFASASKKVTAKPQLQGKAVSQSVALDEAASLLSNSKAPLIAGLDTDVGGMRSAMALADSCGAIIDHLDSRSIFANLRVQQDSGWMTTTLTEVRNRADLVVVIGSAVVEQHPRFFERIISPKPAYQKKPREVILLGPWSSRSLPKELTSVKPEVIKTDMKSIGEIISALRALVSGNSLDQKRAGGINLSVLETLAERLKQSNYSVMTWSAGEFIFPHAELAIEQLAALINQLNQKTRAAGLPLGGNNGATTANQVCTWQSGVPLRSSFASGQPHHDALLYDHERLLEQSETDCLLWISSMLPELTPPETTIPTIVTGHPAMQFKHKPEVFIPTAIPGIDHSGHGFRMDGSVSLPLQKLRLSELSSAADILNQLTMRLS